jgi:hypothetical protein
MPFGLLALTRCGRTRSGMQSPQPVIATTTRKWWIRALDGPYRWGSFDVLVGRYGLRRYRLTVFPPGITVTDRRLVRLWRAWPIAGAVLWLLAVMFFSDTISSPTTTAVVAAAVYLVVGAALFWLVRGVRGRVRSLWAMTLDRYDDPRSDAEDAALATCDTVVGILTAADDLLDAGRISPVEYEALWWEAYDWLAITAGA